MRQARAAVSQQRTRVQVEMPADAAAGFGAAEPAAARYEHQDYAALVQNLGNQAPANEAKDAEFEQLHSAKQTALDALKDQMQDARMSGDDVSMRRIQSSITNLSMAKDVASLKAALASAQAAIASSPTNGNTPDTPEQKAQRILADFDKLNEKATKILDALPLTDAEKEEKKRLDKAYEDAKESNDRVAEQEAMKALSSFTHNMGEEHNSPEAIELAKKMEAKQEQLASVEKNTTLSKADETTALPTSVATQTTNTLESIEQNISTKLAPAGLDEQSQNAAKSSVTLAVANVESAPETPSVNVPKPASNHRTV